MSMNCTYLCLPSLPGEIADLLRRQESYWSVVGVATEQELVDRLTSLSPPLPPITLSNEYEGLNVSQDVGCFIGGAGIYMYMYTCIITPVNER